MIHLLVLVLLVASNLQQSEAQVGICYGTQGDKLPPPQEVVALLKENKITRIRLYEPNPEALKALKGQNIEVVLGMSNDELERFVASQQIADSWVQQNVKAYLPDIKFRYIVVGNEVTPVNGLSKYSFTLFVAIQNIQKAVITAGLQDQVKVTSAFDMSNFNISSVPSGTSIITDARLSFLLPIIKYLARIKSPFLINMYPYYSHVTRLQNIKLDYALFKSTTNVVNDGKFGYKNLFDDMYDSVVSTLEKEGLGDMEVVVSETGWPSAGGVSATLENEKSYITDVIQHVKIGSPKRAGKPIETYLYSVFNENKKQDGPEIERHFGLFHANKQLKFPVTFV